MRVVDGPLYSVFIAMANFALYVPRQAPMEGVMVHDIRPTLAAASRTGIHRRGAMAALLSIITFVSPGAKRISAGDNQRLSKNDENRLVKSERKKKRKKKSGPPGTQGPTGPQGPEGARGPEGPKAISATLIERLSVPCTYQPNEAGDCIATCNTDELAVSGGFSALDPNMTVYQSRKNRRNLGGRREEHQ
jgi:hypothetical protein